VLNYTNPMGVLTNVLARELGNNRVVGLCHGLFSCYAVLKAIFGLKSEEEIQVRFGGLNHFFWILDFQVNGKDGYKLLREKMGNGSFADLVSGVHEDGMGFSSNVYLASEFLENYGYLTYVGDRHTCEFFNCYMTNKSLMERFKLVRTSIEDREKNYEAAEKRISDWTEGRKAAWPLSKKSSRETAADIIHAIAFEKSFMDVVNTVNVGQIENLPKGAVVETMGHVSGRGFTPVTVGPLPEQIAAVVRPHAEMQVKTLEAGLSGNLDDALRALITDPICAHMTASDVKKMGMELLQANSKHLPQFFGK
jgi:alpha-galactosidase/6-phospho-beta-glucosidase family protein